MCFAINVTLSCEAGVVSGNLETLKPKVYENIFPTIIINSQKKEISYSYLENEMRWNSIFKIIDEDELNIMAIHLDGANYTDIFYFNKNEKTFSLAYVGEYGNTINYGQCFN